MKFLRSSLIAWLILAMAAARLVAQTDSDLVRGFRQPPDAARPWVYWFWMGGCVTKEGVTADLEAMARVGIKGALIMNVLQGVIPPKPVVFMQPEWRDIFHHAVREADRLGLQICMHNCDGWSGSGGPWNTPDRAMQQLTWTETRVPGPGRFSGQLPQPESNLDYYRDIAVLAIPAQARVESKPKVTSSLKMRNEANLIDGDPHSEAILPLPEHGKSDWLQLEYAEPVRARGLTVVQRGRGGFSRCELQVSDDGKNFRNLCAFQSLGHKDHIRQSVTVSFPETEARFFRLTLPSAGGRERDLRFNEIEILQDSRINYWEHKAGFSYPNEHGGAPEAFRFRTNGGILGGVESDASDSTNPAVAAIAAKAVIDLTGKMDAQGKLDWDAPPGQWLVLRIGHTPNGRSNAPATEEGRGPACDKLSAEAMDGHFAGMAAKLVKEVGPLAGKAFSGVEIDSWECGIQNWTGAFRQEFRKRRGYDPLPYLPVMAGGRVVESLDVSERFLWDVRRTIADLIGENYYARSRQLCKENGLTFFNEGSGRQQFLYDPIVYQREGDLPMGEFWMGQGGPRVDCKVAASVSHIYDKPVVGAEAFTSSPEFARWTNDPFALKQLGDEAFCMGVTRFVFHRYAHQPWVNFVPGMTMGKWGIHFERTNTWWEQGRAWLDYLARCEYLLQQGQFVADVCYFTGEDVPNYLGRRAELNPPLPAGYDYDGCDAKTILTRMTVDPQGRIALPNGMRYRALLLPSIAHMRPELLCKIRQLVAEGATVVGPKPIGSPSLENYPACDAEVKALAQEVWGDCDGVKVKEHGLGKGRVVWGRPFEEILPGLGALPDFDYQAADPVAKLHYIHRRVGETEVYFVASAQPEAARAACTFRVEGKRPELWRPDTGQMEYPAVFKSSEGRTTVPLDFEPLGSVFVVFRGPLPARHATAIRAAEEAAAPSQPPRGDVRSDNNRGLAGSFTMAFWVKPDRDVTLPKESDSAMMKGGQTFVIYPAPGHEVFGENHAGAGVSIGRNGVCVVEHGARYMSPLLVHAAAIANWTHVAVVYRDGQPTLFLNGQQARTGIKSSRVVHPALGVQHTRKVGKFAGEAAAAVQFDRPLSAEEVAALAAATQPRPKVHWPTLTATADGQIEVQGEHAGQFALELSDGQTRPLDISAPPADVAVAGPWQVAFQAGRGAPDQATFERLVSWTSRPEEGVKYFSGTATYQTKFDVPADLFAADRRLLLDLGRVKNVAEVKLNGKDLGVLWKPPFEANVTGLLKPGANRLEVRVTNLWPNRLIGDAQKPDDGRYDRLGALREWPKWYLEGKSLPSDRYTFSTWKHWNKDDALIESGLLGPVRIRSAMVRKVDF